MWNIYGACDFLPAVKEEERRENEFGRETADICTRKMRKGTCGSSHMDANRMESIQFDAFAVKITLIPMPSHFKARYTKNRRASYLHSRSELSNLSLLLLSGVLSFLPFPPALPYVMESPPRDLFHGEGHKKGRRRKEGRGKRERRSERTPFLKWPHHMPTTTFSCRIFEHFSTNPSLTQGPLFFQKVTSSHSR